MPLDQPLRDPRALDLSRLTGQLLEYISPSSPFGPQLQYALGLLSTTRVPLLKILSEILTESAYTLKIAHLFRPILFDLAARWIDGLENDIPSLRDDREKKLAALVLLTEVHVELYPILFRFLTSPTFNDGPLSVLLSQPQTIARERLHRLLLATFRIININRELPNLLSWDLNPLSSIIWHGNADAPINAHLSSEVAAIPLSAVDNGARLLAIRCYAYQSGMGEAERENVEKQVLGEIYGPECRLEYGEQVELDSGTAQIRKKDVDGWILPVIEVQRIRDGRVNIARTKVEELYHTATNGQQIFVIDKDELSPHTVDVHGVLHLRWVPLDDTSRLNKSGLIETPTTIHALQELALQLSLRAPTLLTSPPSSGKSLLISHLHSLLHPIRASDPPPSNPIITIHLSDTSLDARSLLGAYTSSAQRPGQFEFKDGILVRAMKEGRWVILEDLDKASSEVLGMVIKPLAESMRKDGDGWIGQRAFLDQLGRGRVVAHDDFRLFATRSVTEGRIQEPHFLGSNKWAEVRVGRPKKGEVESIVEKKFAKLAKETVRSVVKLWEDVKSVPTLGANATEMGLRGLERFCRRLEMILPSPALTRTEGDAMDVDMDAVGDSAISTLGTHFTNPILREEIYLSAREVFFPFYLQNHTSLSMPSSSSSSHQAYYKSVAILVGQHLGLGDERREWVLSGRVPEFDIDKDLSASGGGRVRGVRVGRTYLPAYPSKKSLVNQALEKRPFALHKPALTLLSRLATSITLSEPILLTGETGTGKTSVITYLASQLSAPLMSLNLSHQTETSDLIGGMKPVDIRVRAAEVQERWRALFKTSFSQGKNEKFVGEAENGVRLGKWKRVAGLWRESARRGIERCRDRQRKREEPGSTEAPRKRRKVEGVDGQGKDRVTEKDWEGFLREVDEFDVQYIQGKGKFAFAFVEGPLVRALRNGDWVLLDEINLASPETLECISSLLQSPTSSITLAEQTSSLTPVPRHPNFRLFACMNPATDVGKKDLPPTIRSRFTEIYVSPPDADKETLISIVEGYLGPYAVGDRGAIMDVAEFYLGIKDLEGKRELADGGSNKRPHFSMRTLARALTFVQDTVGSGQGGFGLTLRRAIWEGCLMAFTMVLERERGSTEKVVQLAQRWLLRGVKNPKSLLTKEPPVPMGRRREEFVKFGPFYLEKGPLYEGKEGEEDLVEQYVLTPSVERKLIDLARIILTRRVPILIEGPTSAGKTSSVEYLARRTGHRFIRINNHEHTDIQEYIGSYVSDPVTGKLVFKDGLLVKALRNGDWIVLDELNLAPTDVLEALNRLLDDNRELVIPETQEVVKPHPHFMLFATQNPPGLYAGRKVLSRAFRNRFLEVHFEDVPQDELETILCQRCRIAPSYGKKIVAIFHELQKRRQSSRVFESKQGFATLRDLFRWAGRDAVGYQELAENGYMLIAERVRREDDKAAVKEVIEDVMNVKIDEKSMYRIHDNKAVDVTSYLGCPVPSVSHIIWTNAMQRLFTLVSRALKFNEPVLLVGETGSGKTSVCEVFADAQGQRLHGLNCHQNTETADLIGGLRPVRNRATREADLLQEAREVLTVLGVEDGLMTNDDLANVLHNVLKSSPELPQGLLTRIQVLQANIIQLQSIFEWHDGPLVEAMRRGDVFLLDEISLADDSVLERLNSVLEPGRSIVLAEKGGADDASHPAIRANNNFKLVATMNPGGDYGKKELSPALRNRFTEIWVPRVEDRHDLELVVDSLWKHVELRSFTTMLLDFTEWLCWRVADHTLFSLRDVLGWVTFMNSSYEPHDGHGIPAKVLFHHAAHMTFLDGLASLPQLSGYTIEGLQQVKNAAVTKLMELVPLASSDAVFSFLPSQDPNSLCLGTFCIPKGPRQVVEHVFNLHAPTTRDNAMRVIRACQVPKPILLEGSPGVGKTSLIAAIANIAGHELCRINLSDQTDLIDLFGSDLPIEGGVPGEFAWKDAEFLKALQEGHWVLLDEMNLAPQAVLEGLNAVLDHRGTVFIPELGRSFSRHPNFRIFAAQNPLNQGGGRKGLPKSFVNRFTKVYVEELTPSDLLLVCRLIFPELDEGIVESMVSYNMRLQDLVVRQRRFAKEGTPWEFNLRDIIRWGHLLHISHPTLHPINHLRTIYIHRFRSHEDQRQAKLLFDEVFHTSLPFPVPSPNITVSPHFLCIGHHIMRRQNWVSMSSSKRLLKAHLPILESLSYCISQSWLAILTGHRGSGKTDVIRALAQFSGRPLQEIPVNSATDTMDLLGSFEQVDLAGRSLTFIQDALHILEEESRTILGTQSTHTAIKKLREAQRLVTSPVEVLQVVASALQDTPSLSSSRSDFLGKINSLLCSLDASGHFEWVDGPLVEAIKYGHWLLMDGANLCNPSVLDRLNSLCEQGGTLTLSERGYVNGSIEVLKPHPNFRLFMTVDPQHGELSRAMRNRGIEISMLGSLTNDDKTVLKDSKRIPSEDQSHQIDLAPLTFDAMRRGLTFAGGWATFTSSTGMVLDQDSALSCLLDTAPAVFMSLENPESVGDASLFFLGRTLSDSYLRPFSRLLLSLEPAKINLQVAEFLAFLEEAQITSLRQRLRESSLIPTSVPSDLVLAQPFDFYLTSPACIIESDNTAFKSTHYALLQALDLATSIFLDQEYKRRFMIPALKKYSTHKDQIDRILRATESFIICGEHVATELLNNPKVPNSESQVGLSPFLLLSRYCRELRTIISGEGINHSALQAICRLVGGVVDTSSQMPDGVLEQVQSFRNAVALQSGIGLFDIWAKLGNQAGLAYIPKTYDAVAASDLSSKGIDKLVFRRQIVDYLSLRTLPVALGPDVLSKLQIVEADLSKVMQLEVLDNQAELATPPANPILLIAELGLFQQMIESPLAVLESLAEIIKLNIYMGGAPSKTARLQHLAWQIEAGSDTMCTLSRIQLDWLETTWNIADPSDALLGGPSMLLQPTTLASTMALCYGTGDTMEKAAKTQADLLEQARAVRLHMRPTGSRVHQLNNFLRLSLSIVGNCFVEVQVNKDPLQCIPRMLDTLKSAGQDRVHAVMSDYLSSLDADYTSRGSTIRTLAQIWVKLGQLIARLFVPDIPVDPLAVEHHAVRYRSHFHESLTYQKKLHGRLGQLTSGSVGSVWNGCIEYLDSQWNDQIKPVPNLPEAPLRDSVRLQAFWAEAVQFRDQVILSTKLSDLLKGLTGGDSSRISQEKTFQQSVVGFVRRLDTIYGDFEDLTTPLKLSAAFLRLGLRLGAYFSLTDGASEALALTVNNLVTYPAVASAPALCSNLTMTGIPPFKRILLALSAINVIKTTSPAENAIALLETSFDQALRLWHIDLARQSELEAAASSLYRRNKDDHVDIGDAELEEREFLSLFPSFEDVFEPDAQPEVKPSQTKSEKHISESDVEELFMCHYRLLSNDIGVGGAIQDLREASAPLVASMLTSSISALPDDLDHWSTYLQFFTLHQKNRLLQANPMQGLHPYDFYKDPNVPELHRATTTISSLRSRLSSIIEEWPDQMVLHHLREKCDLILRFGIQSPVAKVLSALEQLLLQTQDWEMYANRDNTIKANQQELVQLIVGWRRLELTSWRGLLDSQAQGYEKGIAPWWFRLYDATIRGPLNLLGSDSDSESHDASSQYLQTLLPLLDEYIRTSSMGQYRARLQLLHSYEDYLELIIPRKNTHQRSLLQRIQRILASTRKIYDIFSPSIASHLSSRRLQLEKEVRDFIKLASWKDVNVQALKASAQKTHHQLYKVIRKFREVLKQPASDLFTSPSANTADTPASLQKNIESNGSHIGLDQALTQLPVPDVATPYVQNPRRTISRFEELVISRILPFVRHKVADLVNDLAANVITTSGELASATIPTTPDSEIRKKQLKALLVRKRKAWSDLLKELKQAGFSVNVKSDILRQNSDALWMRDQHRISVLSDADLSSTKCENYLYRLHILLPQLRGAMSDHHSDLTTRELQRGLMFVESIFSYAMSLRSRLAQNLERYQQLSSANKRLSVLAEHQLSLHRGEGSRGGVLFIRSVLAQILGTLGELQEGLLAYNELKPESPSPEQLLASVEECQHLIANYTEQIVGLSDVMAATSQAFLTSDEYNMVSAAMNQITVLSEQLTTWARDYPHLHYLFLPVYDWLNSRIQNIIPFTAPEPAHGFQPDSLQPLVNALLVTVQNMLHRCPVEDDSHSGNDEHYLFKGIKVTGEMTHSLNLETISSTLDSLIPFLLSDPATSRDKMKTIKPFLDVYLTLVKEQLSSHVDWTTALFKLDYVLVSIMRRLAKEGFCQPPEGEEQGEEGDGGQATGGLGLGEGAGAENVSKEIEDESQVEGLKGEDGEKDEQKEKSGRDDKGTIEMSEDIGGDLEDVSDAEDDDEGESDDESGIDPEERIEDLDPKDPNAVDEKLWGNEKGPESGGKDDEKIDEDRSAEKEGDSEVVAKEGEHSQRKEKQEPSSERKEQKSEQEKAEETIADMEEDNEVPNSSGAPMDDHVPDANTLDLPEDMNLEEEFKQDEGQSSDMEEDKEPGPVEEPMEDVRNETKVEDDKHTENWAEEDRLSDEMPEPMDEDEGPEHSDQPKEAREDKDQEKPEDPENKGDDKNEATARPDLSAGQGVMAPDQEQNPDLGDSAATGQASGTQASANQPAKAQNAQQDSSPRPADQHSKEAQAPSSESQNAGANTSGTQEGQMPSQPDSSILTNPLRSLGDAISEVQQRFDEILSSERREAPKEHVGEVTNPFQLEYLQPDDADHDMQALGPAGQEQVAKLKDLKLVDEDEQQDAVPMDIDMALEEDLKQPPAQDRFRHEELTSSERRDDVEGAILSGSNPATDQPSLSSATDALTRKVDPGVLEEIEQAAETSLREWQSQGFPEAGGEKIWRTYESLTHDLAYALCEQLRLILEPSLATRLKGDYRTGKRLNMKKIISYIASDYTKDKIWLRRTRPSQREYQVLISIDDSRSMAESHSVHLAFETLALVSKALNRLESGDIAIAKFGEGVEMLHGFDDGPFTDQAGTKVMNAFHFNQKATNVLSLIETSLKVLEKAREHRATSSAIAADLWQLQFIISDGMCQDHEKLRTALRKAEEQRVMIVFVILDSLHSTAGISSADNPNQKGATQGSILTMDKAEFKNVDGRMELQLQKYLDSFPFEYYVVLRNVEALPEVLASTLKQFFERISED